MTFENFSELIEIAEEKSIYITLNNGYNLPVAKSDIKRLADCMIENGNVFRGDIDGIGKGWVVITFLK